MTASFQVPAHSSATPCSADTGQAAEIMRRYSPQDWPLQSAPSMPQIVQCYGLCCLCHQQGMSEIETSSSGHIELHDFTAHSSGSSGSSYKMGLQDQRLKIPVCLQQGQAVMWVGRAVQSGHVVKRSHAAEIPLRTNQTSLECRGAVGKHWPHGDSSRLPSLFA
jgi:hypothetical protein